MRIDVRGVNLEVTDELREAVVSRFRRVGKQVSDLATLDIELREELKGVTLRATESSPEMLHSIHELAEDIRRQVKRHREKRRKRHQTRRLVDRLRSRSA